MERIRLSGINIAHFKNVRNGIIDLSKGHNADSASNILGVYGQNGSGKTALIDSLRILKHLLSSFPCCSPDEIQEWIHYINIESKSSELIWTFQIDDERGNLQLVDYSVTLQKSEDSIAADNVVRTSKIQFVNERISVTSRIGEERTRKAPCPYAAWRLSENPGALPQAGTRGAQEYPASERGREERDRTALPGRTALAARQGCRLQRASAGGDLCL